MSATTRPLLLATLLLAFLPERTAAPLVLHGRDWVATVHDRGLRFETTKAAGTVLELGPATVLRGGRALGQPPAAPRRHGEAVHVDRGAFTSHFTPGSAGLELAWGFSQKPPGHGDVVVSFSASQLAKGAPGGGLEWSAARLGPATWVDAAGRRTPIEATSTGDEVRYVIAEALLEGSAFPAVLDPVLSPAAATPIDPSAGRGLFEGVHEQVSLAFTGTSFLAVWLDGLTPGNTLWVTEVDATDGGVRFDNPVELASGSLISPVVAPAVAVAPGAPLEALVVWQDVSGIQSALLGPSGVVTRRSALAPGSRPAVAWSQGAGAFLVVWETTGPVRGALVQRNGTTTFLNFFEVGTEPAVACGPLECLVAYLKGSEVKVQPVGALVTSNMPPVTVAPGGSTFGGRRSPAIALADTTGYVVVWVEPTANNGLVAFRSETMPSVFSPVTLPALPSGLKGEPALACDSARCSLVFTISNPAPNRAMHVSFALTSGSSPPSDLTPGVSRVSGPAVVNGPSSGATPRLVAWTEQRLVQSDIMGRLVLGDALGAAFPISVGAATQRSVALSAGANETTLAVWTDSRVDEGDVYGRVLLLDGGALGPSFSIATGPGPQLAPSAAWNGVEWLVLFIDKDNSRVQARAVTAAGLVAGGPPSLIATALDDVDSQTSVAAVGRQFFATWLQTSASVFGARITPGAPAVVEPLGRPLTPAGAASCTATSVASNGSAWLAAWTCASELTAAEVFVDGGLANPVRIASPAEAPAVVFGDGRYLLVWAESRMTGPNILGRFWPTGATIQPPFSIETAPRERSRPAAAFSDWGFVTTWRERQALRFDVVGARLVDGGVQRFAVAALERVEEAGAAIACPAAGRCLVGGGVSAVGASRAVRALRNDVRNAVPVAMGATIAVQGRTAVRVRAVDADDEALTIAFDAGTLQAGALEETDEGWFYVPRAGASGTDVASFTASDGVDRSEPALVTFSLVGAAGGGAGGGGDGAGVVTDGGLETPPVVVFAPSCGCVSGDGLAWWLAVLAFAARRRRNGRGSTAG